MHCHKHPCHDVRTRTPLAYVHTHTHSHTHTHDVLRGATDEVLGVLKSTQSTHTHARAHTQSHTFREVLHGAADGVLGVVLKYASLNNLEKHKNTATHTHTHTRARAYRMCCAVPLMRFWAFSRTPA